MGTLRLACAALLLLASLAGAAVAEEIRLPAQPAFPTDPRQCTRLNQRYVEIDRLLSARLSQCNERNRNYRERWVDPGPCSPVSWQASCAPVFEQANCVRKQGYDAVAACRRQVSLYLATRKSREEAKEHAERFVRQRTGIDFRPAEGALDLRDRLLTGAKYVRARARPDDRAFLGGLGLGLSAIHRRAPGPSIAKHFFDQAMRRIVRQFQDNLARLDGAMEGVRGLDAKGRAIVGLNRSHERHVAAIERRAAAARQGRDEGRARQGRDEGRARPTVRDDPAPALRPPAVAAPAPRSGWPAHLCEATRQSLDVLQRMFDSATAQRQIQQYHENCL